MCFSLSKFLLGGFNYLKTLYVVKILVKRKRDYVNISILIFFSSFAKPIIVTNNF